MADFSQEVKYHSTEFQPSEPSRKQFHPVAAIDHKNLARPEKVPELYYPVDIPELNPP